MYRAVQVEPAADQRVRDVLRNCDPHGLGVELGFGQVEGNLGAINLDDPYGKWVLDAKTQAALIPVLQAAGLRLSDPVRQEEASYDVKVFFTSSGSYDPGRPGGAVEQSYAPEGEEEREIERVTLTARDFDDPNIDGKSINLPFEVATRVGEHFREEIESSDINTSGYEDTGPDHDFF